MLAEARDWLPFSDAKKGPLADLTASGKAIVDTLAAGIRQAGSQPVNQALQVELAGVPAIDVTAPTLPSLSLPNLDDLSAMLGGFLDRLPDLTTMTALPVGPVPAGVGCGRRWWYDAHAVHRATERYGNQRRPAGNSAGDCRRRTR